jgi:nitroreductase
VSEIDAAAAGEDAKLFECIRTARAIRRLRSDPVPEALIRKVCQAGTFAPSGGNRQPWVFIAVTEAERRAYVAERYRRAFHEYIAPAVEAAKDPSFPDAGRRNMRAAIYLADHLHEAPVHLFVAGWKRRGQAQHQALFPAIQNVLLACRALGLGASLTTIHLSFRREIDPWLGLSEDTPSCALLPIGWPLGKHGVPPRKSVDDVLFFERVSPREAPAR